MKQYFKNHKESNQNNKVQSMKSTLNNNFNKNLTMKLK